MLNIFFKLNVCICIRDRRNDHIIAKLVHKMQQVKLATENLRKRLDQLLKQSYINLKTLFSLSKKTFFRTEYKLFKKNVPFSKFLKQNNKKALE